jgi:hypothetical protein
VGRDIIAAFVTWLHGMLVGPVLSFNTEEGFVKGCLGSNGFVANTEIYLETLP